MLFISLGENCLTDDILRRHNVKGFSTPYSPCRSNIDYALFLEANKYKNLLNKDHLLRGVAGKHSVVRSTAVLECDKIYDPSHMNGFEFTHHDTLNNDAHRDSYKRKVKRLDDIRHEKDVSFFYHHRINKNTDIKLLRKKLLNFSSYYKGNNNQVLMILFYQTIVQDCTDRRLDFLAPHPCLLEFNFITSGLWGGNDPDLFWARGDDDLIKKMIDKTKLFCSGGGL